MNILNEKIISILFLSLFLFKFAATAENIIIDEDFCSENITSKISYYIDNSGEMNIEDIQNIDCWSSIDKDIVNISSRNQDV